MFALKFLTQHFVLVTMFCVDQVQSSFLLLSPPPPPRPPQHNPPSVWTRSRAGSAGSNWKLSKENFLALRAQERVSVFRKPLCWNRGRCNHSDGGGGVSAAVKNGRGLKNGVMGCDRWGGSRFKRGEELQRLNPSNSTGRPRSPTPARFITCQVASRGRERLKVVNCGASYTFALAQIMRFWRGRRGGHSTVSQQATKWFI